MDDIDQHLFYCVFENGSDGVVVADDESEITGAVFSLNLADAQSILGVLRAAKAALPVTADLRELLAERQKAAAQA